jgi:hypothetical protein
MYTMFSIFIFVAILFTYIHVQSQWKTSDDLEIYEADYQSAKQLQEIVAVKQPVLFQIADPDAQRFCDRFQLQKMQKYDNVDVHVKEVADYYAASDDAAVDYVSLPLRSAYTLLSSDQKAKYFSENNGVFVEESGLDTVMQPMDAFLKPALTAYTKYDLLFGSAHAYTPLRYHTVSQQYFVVASGKIRVKMCPPKYRKVLPLVKDYENYEFRTSMNVFDGKRIDSVKFLDFEVHAGSTLFVPPYWWYAIQFSAETTVAGFAYDQVMNIAAQSNHWVLFYLQQANITTRFSNRVIAMEEDDDDDREAFQPTIPESNRPKEIVTNAGTYVVSGSNAESIQE